MLPKLHHLKRYWHLYCLWGRGRKLVYLIYKLGVINLPSKSTIKIDEELSWISTSKSAWMPEDDWLFLLTRIKRNSWKSRKDKSIDALELHVHIKIHLKTERFTLWFPCMNESIFFPARYQSGVKMLLLPLPTTAFYGFPFKVINEYVPPVSSFIFFSFSSTLPLHSSLLQTSVCSKIPSHNFPPFSGWGSLHSLKRALNPPQESVHGPQTPQSPHEPSTEIKNADWMVSNPSINC